jgi:hypothetical protein
MLAKTSCCRPTSWARASAATTVAIDCDCRRISLAQVLQARLSRGQSRLLTPAVPTGGSALGTLRVQERSTAKIDSTIGQRAKLADLMQQMDPQQKML